MSSKFSPSPVIQQPPKVCKKVPLPPPPPNLDFQHIDLYASVDFAIPRGTVDAHIVFSIPLIPSPSGYLHTGTYVTGPDAWYLTLSSSPTFENHAFEIRYYENAVLLSVVTWTIIGNPANNPWDSGLLLATIPPATAEVRARLTS